MDLLLIIIVSIVLFIIAYLGIENKMPTERQKQNIEKWENFKLQLMENHLDMFFVGCLILIAIILMALKIGGVL